MNRLPTIIFLIGILILIITQLRILKKDTSHVYTTIWIIFAIILLVVAWIIRQAQIRQIRKYEKYANDYDYAIQNGLLVAGTVYAAYPEQVGGLGWVL